MRVWRSPSRGIQIGCLSTDFRVATAPRLALADAPACLAPGGCRFKWNFCCITCERRELHNVKAQTQ